MSDEPDDEQGHYEQGHDEQGHDEQGHYEQGHYEQGHSVPAEAEPVDEHAESLRQTITRHPAQVGVLGALVVLALILGMVFAFGSSSGTKGKPLSQAAVTPTLATTTVPHRPTATAPAHPTAAASGAATTTATGAPAPAPVVAAATPPTAPPGPCTASDFALSTTTDSASYQRGAPVTATTKLVDTTSCIFDPVASGKYSCPTTIVFVDANGSQAYPVSGQGEQCAAVAGGTLLPGATRTVTVAWPQPATAGQYEAVGNWAWSQASGPPGQGAAASASFSVG